MSLARRLAVPLLLAAGLMPSLTHGQVHQDRVMDSLAVTLGPSATATIHARVAFATDATADGNDLRAMLRISVNGAPVDSAELAPGIARNADDPEFLVCSGPPCAGSCDTWHDPFGQILQRCFEGPEPGCWCRGYATHVMQLGNGVLVGDVIEARLLPFPGSQTEIFAANDVLSVTVSSTSVGLIESSGLALTLTRNPVVPGTRLLARFALPASGRTVVRLFDARGALVATVLDREYEAGAHTLQWGGSDTGPTVAAAGVYFLVLDHLGRRTTARVVVL